MHNIIITIFNSQFWSINCKFPGSINIDIRRHLYSTILDSNKLINLAAENTRFNYKPTNNIL